MHFRKQLATFHAIAALAALALSGAMMTSCENPPGGNPGSIFTSTPEEKIETAAMIAGAIYLRSEPTQVHAVAAIATKIDAALKDDTIDAVDVASLAEQYLPPGPDTRILIAALSKTLRLNVSEGNAAKFKAVASGLALAADIYGEAAAAK